MNIDQLPQLLNFHGAIKLNREVSMAIIVAEKDYIFNSIEKAEALKAYFLFCSEYLEDNIISKKKVKEDKKKPKDSI